MCGGPATGCGGRKLSEVEHEQPQWLQYAAREWGYGRITVRDGGELLYEFVQSKDGAVADSVRLYNTRGERRTCGLSDSGAPAPAAPGRPLQRHQPEGRGIASS